MRTSLLCAALSASTAVAFPWMTPQGMEALLNHPEARQEIQRKIDEYHAGEAAKKTQPRQLGTGLVGGVLELLGGTVEALLDNVLGLIPTDQAVKGLDKFPEGMYFSPTPLFLVVVR